YSPTENTTFSTTFLIEKDYDVNIPIGRPIANSTAYIVDKSGRLQPIGITGEIWLGGDGIAKGYMNNPELTVEKYVPNPFAGSTDLLYKTGDLGCWMPDGNIRFLGRIDHQVKIRGFRIEPQEIEGRLLNCSQVKDAVVSIKKFEGNEKFLVAYIVGNEPLSTRDLREELAAVLPEYMIPS
ncbi:MAG: AMP-binding protein, partial [bacterium]|nr:AMP-binding protein [bacterium]